MKKAELTKIEYKLTTAIEGTCPHCKETIDLKNIEELSDDVPPQEFFERRADALNQNIDQYMKFVSENPTYPILNNLLETWRNRVDALQIRSSIRSESIYVYNGDCPYCKNNIDIKEAMSVRQDAPPQLRDPFNEEKSLFDWLTIIKNKDLAKLHDPSENSHFLENCPLCGEMIHLTDGEFFKKSDCPIHSIDLTGASIIKVE